MTMTKSHPKREAEAFEVTIVASMDSVPTEEATYLCSYSNCPTCVTTTQCWTCDCPLDD